MKHISTWSKDSLIVGLFRATTGETVLNIWSYQDTKKEYVALKYFKTSNLAETWLTTNGYTKLSSKKHPALLNMFHNTSNLHMKEWYDDKPLALVYWSVEYRKSYNTVKKFRYRQYAKVMGLKVKNNKGRLISSDSKTGYDFNIYNYPNKLDKVDRFLFATDTLKRYKFAYNLESRVGI